MRRWYWAPVGLLIIAGGAAVSHAMDKPRDVATSAKLVVRYWAESSTLEAQGKKAIVTVGDTPVLVSRDQAQLRLTSTKAADATGILPGSVGQPASLGSANIVTAETTPTAYAEAATQPAKQVAAKLAKTPATAPTSWTMDVVGDIGLGRSVYTTMVKKHDFDYPFQAFSSELKSVDLALANLECAISDNHAVISDSGMTFVTPAAAAQGLKDSGIDAVSLANNHSFNAGAAGYVDTIDAVKQLGIAPVGGGTNASEAHAPQILNVKGVRVALLGYSSIVGSTAATATTPGMAYISMAPWGPLSETDVAQMQADIKAAKQQADVVLVYYHWGTEYTHDANADQRTVAHAAIDAGADVVLGSHPHWVQGVEWYNGHLIAYSLGNFIFDQDWSPETKQGTMLKLSFSGSKLATATLVPYDIVDNLKPQPASPASAKQVISDIATHSWWPK